MIFISFCKENNLLNILPKFMVLEDVTDAEKCCRENGVLDVCFGFCLKEREKTGTRSFGICGKWFKQINECRKGSFI